MEMMESPLLRAGVAAVQRASSIKPGSTETPKKEEEETKLATKKEEANWTKGVGLLNKL